MSLRLTTALSQGGLDCILGTGRLKRKYFFQLTFLGLEITFMRNIDKLIINNAFVITKAVNYVCAIIT